MDGWIIWMVTKIWDSTSNNEIIVRSTAKEFDSHRVRQNIAYLVIIIIVVVVVIIIIIIISYYYYYCSSEIHTHSKNVIHTLTIVNGFFPGQWVVQAVVRRRRRSRQVSESNRDSHELDITLRVVPDQQLNARPQVTTRLVVDLSVCLDRYQVLFQRVARTVDVSHPVTAGSSTVDEVAQTPVFEYL